MFCRAFGTGHMPCTLECKECKCLYIGGTDGYMAFSLKEQPFDLYWGGGERFSTKLFLVQSAHPRHNQIVTPLQLYFNSVTYLVQILFLMAEPFLPFKHHSYEGEIYIYTQLKSIK